MEIPLYLAQTATEFRNCSNIPEHFAWMACHFSPYGTGLSNLPDTLPSESLIIINDRTPINGHDPEQITKQLIELIQNHHPTGILLDFQRPRCAQTEYLTKHLVQALPYPVSVSELYARGIDCPVFLPPVPLDVPVSEYIKPWQRREVWLETALDGLVLTLTEDGCHATPLPPGETPEGVHRDEQLHCSYNINVEENVQFALFRTRNDLEGLLKEAEILGVTRAVGLWQELG